MAISFTTLLKPFHDSSGRKSQQSGTCMTGTLYSIRFKFAPKRSKRHWLPPETVKNGVTNSSCLFALLLIGRPSLGLWRQ